MAQFLRHFRVPISNKSNVSPRAPRIFARRCDLTDKARVEWNLYIVRRATDEYIYIYIYILAEANRSIVRRATNE